MHEKEAREAVLRAEELQHQLGDLTTINTSLREEIKDMEAYIDELQEMVTRAEEAEKLAEDQLNLQVGSVDIREKLIIRLKEEIEQFKKRGMTEEKRIEWDRKDEELRAAKANAISSQKQLKATMFTVYDLQDKLAKLEKQITV